MAPSIVKESVFTDDLNSMTFFRQLTSKSLLKIKNQDLILDDFEAIDQEKNDSDGFYRRQRSEDINYFLFLNSHKKTVRFDSEK